MKPDETDDALRDVQRATNELLDERPDARIRAAVLAAASRAVDARPRSTTRGATVAPLTRRRWPLSAAALLVVSLTTGLLVTRAMREEPDRVLTTAAVEPTKPIRIAPSDAIASSTEAAPSTQEEAQERTQDRLADPTRAPPAEPRVTAREDPSKPQSAPAPNASRRAVAPLVRQSDNAIDAPRRDDEARPPAQAKVATAESTSDASKRASGASPSALVADPPSAGASDAASPAPSSAPSSAMAPSSPPAPAMPTASVRERARSLPLDVPSSTAARDSRATPLALNAAPTNAARRVARGSTAPEPATPEAWVERILKLRAAGDDDAADREVAALHDRYPDFVIPVAARDASGTR